MTALSVAPEDAGGTAYGKTVSDLQDAIKINGTKITGRLHYIKEFTGFSSDTSQQQGNFLAMKVEAPADATVKFKLVGGSSPEKTLPADDKQIVWKIATTSQKPHLEITYKGSTGSIEYDLTGLTLESDG